MIYIENSVLELQLFLEKLTKNDKISTSMSGGKFSSVELFLSKKIVLAEKALNFLKNQKNCLDFIKLKLNEKNWNGE